MSETTHYIGKDALGTRYYVDIRLDEVNKPDVEFTDHTIGTLTHTLAISGHTILPRKRDWDTAGQILDQILAVTEPAPGWTLADIANVHFVWSRWHLNDMNAGSDEHERMQHAEPEPIELIVGGTPDSTGYTYGSKWLAKQLPALILTTVRYLQKLPK